MNPKSSIVIFILLIIVDANVDCRANEVKNVAKQANQLIAMRCLECHRGRAPKGGLDLSTRMSALTGGDSGAAVKPGKPDQSLLWQNVMEDAMPPEDKQKLTEEEKQILLEWIRTGAIYSASALDPFQYTNESRAGYDWWSLQPIVRPAVPRLDSPLVRNPIDAFVVKKLREHNLDPSPAAEPRVLIRRLFFDLIGLPPSPDQIQAFAKNPSNQAYANIIDKLLESPHYGERWGRHWLDVARFGESDGFERNHVRENQWYFRDWVIQAVNKDMPYDEFARLQIAGDYLTSGRRGLSAVAFLTAGVHNTVVGGSEFMKRTARQDELEEIAGAVGQSFVGLTVNCARCHDHKFDPISQTEYYRFVSALSGVFHGDREFHDDTIAKEISQLQSTISDLQEQIRLIDEPVQQEILKRRKENGTKPEPPSALYTWEFDNHLNDSSGKIIGKKIGSPKLEGGALIVDDGSSYVETSSISQSIDAKTLEALVQLSHLDQRGGGAISLQTPDGKIFDAIVFGERQERRWMAGSNGFVRSQEFGGPEEKEAIDRPVHLAVVYHADGTIERYREGQPYGEVYKTGLQAFDGNSVIRFGIRHLPAGGNMHLRGKIFRARLYDRALRAVEVAAAAGVESRFVADSEIIAVLDNTTKTRREKLIANRVEAESKLAKLGSTKKKIYTVAPRTPGTTRFLHRGNAMDEGDVVTPGAVRAVSGVDADFRLNANAADQERRLKLADWIAHANNPLFARVIVNRLWHYHFGTGIVETPNDFGFNGGRPSHSELLDWLSSEIIAQSWSLKSMHRLMMNSHTYRQSSKPNAKALQIDVNNRLLWRKSPTRMDAETLRDSMLFVAGKLNPKQFGPGFRDVSVKYLEGTTYYTPLDQEDDEFHRRTVYRFAPRGGRSAILDTFDCPDPATAAPRRSVTTTPLQALALLNNDFSVRMAKHFAHRISGIGNDKHEQIQWAYRLAFGRSADPEESAAALRFVSKHGLPAFARVIFNSNEFVIID